MSDTRTPAHVAQVQGARPYGAAGNMPADAVVTARKAHTADARLYVSDVPFEQPYVDRPFCQGTRKSGEACRGKARPALRMCEAHSDQE